MARVGVRQSQSLDIEPCEKECDEKLLNVFAEHVVNESQNLAYIRMRSGEGAEVRSSRCHEQRGSNTVATYVSDDDSEGTVPHGEEVEEIPCRRIERMHRRANVKALQLRHLG